MKAGAAGQDKHDILSDHHNISAIISFHNIETHISFPNIEITYAKITYLHISVDILKWNS